MTRRQFLALATLTLLVASVLRIWQLATYPPGPHYDEAAELLIARSIAFGGARFFPMVEAYQGRGGTTAARRKPPASMCA